MRMHDEFSGTITLTENSSRELFKVLQEQDEAFINDVLCGRCGFTLKSADGRSVELVPNTNKRCQSVESVESVEQTEKTCDNCGTPRDKCVYCIEEDRMWTPQTDCGWK